MPLASQAPRQAAAPGQPPGRATTNPTVELARLASSEPPVCDAVAVGCTGQARRAFLLCRGCADPRILRSWHAPVEGMSRLDPKVVAWTGHRPDIFRDAEAA